MRIKPAWIAALSLFLLQERIKPAWIASLSFLLLQEKTAKKLLTDPKPLHKQVAASSEDISLFSSLAGKDSEKVAPSSGVKVMTAQERMAYSFSLSCRLSASAQTKDSPKDSEISLLSDTGGGKHDGRFGEAVAKG
jgi:hypothetical protein